MSATRIDKELDEIFEKYGYFLGLAYEDENGNLATHEQGVVKEKVLELFTTAQHQAYQQGYDDRTLEADHELEDAKHQLLDELMEQKCTAGVINPTTGIRLDVDWIPVSAIEALKEGLK